MKKRRRFALTCIALLLLIAVACRSGMPEEAVEAPTAVPTEAPAPVPETPVPTIETDDEVIGVKPVETPVITLPPAPTPTPTPEPTPAPTAVPTGPVITLIGGDEITLTADFTFSDPGYFADGADGSNLTGRMQVSGEVVPYVTGTYEITYSVTDDEGRTASRVRRVEVVPKEMPEIVTPPEKTVYLTFDDGPCAYTEKLLDVLKKYDAKATFFIVGNKTRTDLIKRAYEEGHSIGVHSYTHDYKTVYKNEQSFFDDFLKTEEVIKEQTGSYTYIFRFPGGSGNTVSRRNKGLMTRLTKIMEDMGYRYFDWNVTAGDASGESYTAENIKNRIVSGMRSHPDYAVVLQHDIHPISVRAVESVLIWGQKNGYTFLALDLTSPVLHSKVQN